jgi:hypothetical protein
MRAAISLLVSSLVFGSLAFNCQATANHLSSILLSSSGSQHLVSAKPKSKSKPKPNQPENPTPNRGSGRRDLMKYIVNTHPSV